MSQVSQLSKLTFSIIVTAAVTLPSPSLPQLLLFPSNHITWFAISFCDWLVWCLFPPIGTCFLACKHFLIADTFMSKASFYHFFLHQTQSKRDSSVCEKVWRTLFIINPVLDAPARPSTQEVGHGVGLAASYTWTSTDSDSRTDMVWTRLVSLIHNSQFRTRQNGTEPPAKSRSSSRHYRYKSACFLGYVVGVDSAVTGSGVHMAMVAMVDNASGIRKAFMK